MWTPPVADRRCERSAERWRLIPSMLWPGTSWPWHSRKPDIGTARERRGTGRSPWIRDTSAPRRSWPSTTGGGALTTARPCGRTARWLRTHCTGSGGSSPGRSHSHAAAVTKRNRSSPAPLLSLGSSVLAAQGTTTASVSGTVTDDSSRGIESADVQVINRTTGVVTSSVTRDAGRYLVQGLEVGGPYAIVIRRIGFATETRDNVFLSLGQDLRMDVRLRPEAAVLPPVVVPGNVDPAFSPSHTGVAMVVSDSALRRLPTANRDLYGFVVLAPQVSTANGLSGGGVNHRFNNFLIDGASELGVFGRLNGAVYGAKAISIEAATEYQIVLSPYAVSLGDFAGTLINAVTKSGTNDLHGTAFFYARSDQLAGNGSFQGASSYQSQAGFSLGGPIMRDRVHFFLASEFQQRRTPANGPYVGQSASSQTPLPADTADITRFAQTLAAKGLQAGTGGLVDTHDPGGNLFARVDVALPAWNSRLVLRYNYTRADSGALSRPETAVATTCFTRSCFPLSSVQRHQLAA